MSNENAANNPIALSWAERLDDLRHCTGFHLRRFSRLIKIDKRQILRILAHRTASERKGKPYFPTLVTIRKIRKFEEIFAVELAQYRSDRDAYDRLRSRRAKWVKVWREYDGEVRIAVFPGYRNTNLPPIDLTQRPSDLAALGGMEAYRDIVLPEGSKDLAWIERTRARYKLYRERKQQREQQREQHRDLQRKARAAVEASVEDWVEEA